MGFPKVLSPDPDLSPLMDLKVTLAELQDALETLTQDINRRLGASFAPVERGK